MGDVVGEISPQRNRESCLGCELEISGITLVVVGKKEQSIQRQDMDYLGATQWKATMLDDSVSEVTTLSHGLVWCYLTSHTLLSLI